MKLKTWAVVTALVVVTWVLAIAGTVYALWARFHG